MLRRSALCRILPVFVPGLVWAFAATVQSAEPIVVTPAEVRLEGNFARAQLVVSRPNADGRIDTRSEDLTNGASFTSSDPAVVTVSPAGQLRAIADGQAKISIAVGDATQEVNVTVSG
ncbi:MAG TPA: Ig-like domain-containing protein, partial [Pirellulaceae bacterium]|nr:Ig-like domain-containing protein [Pirellulaceae bacterium]